MPISDFLPLMPATIAHRAPATHDKFGKVATWGSSTNYRARVSYETHTVPSKLTGQDKLTSIVVWVGGLITGLSVDSEITLPDGSTPTLHAWDQPSDEVGGHHMKLYFT